jgi:hypothetical protein
MAIFDHQKLKEIENNSSAVFISRIEFVSADDFALFFC